MYSLKNSAISQSVVRSKVLMALIMQVTAFWDVMTRGLVGSISALEEPAISIFTVEQ
jgi:hypothetical protein